MSDLLTVAEVAALLNISPETVTRRFAKEKGVIDLGNPGNLRKRRYRVLRIPRTVIEKYVLMRGGRITVPEPPAKKPSRSAKPAPTEDELTHDLAVLATQHGDAARKTVERIARRARAMSFVPTDQWQDMVWFDEEE